MNPGARSVPVSAHPLLPAAMVALATAIILAGILFAVVLVAADLSVAGAPAQDLLLAPFRWVPSVDRGLA